MGSPAPQLERSAFPDGDQMNKEELLEQISNVLSSAAGRAEKAERAAHAVRLTGGYRWVGIYDVDEREISNIAWSGIGAPAYPRFPVTQGLSSHAVSSRSSVISNDVANDPRYLTAFGNTQSEIIIPVLDPEGHRVVGTIDVESERKGAFTEEDGKALEACARALAPLWR
jgi:putative methionine-R-sulfoxide reductase with GAF domain